MPQSLAKILMHVTFSTKHREPFLTETIRHELEAYMTVVLQEFESPPIVLGATADHVHILLLLSKNFPLSRIVEVAKVRTSKWIKTKGEFFRNFAWQSGYFGASLAQAAVPDVVQYIRHQQEHHKKRTFQEECRLFLSQNGIVYDERYAWD